ncbi:hypothetical protein HY991_01720 [Candidatus Micrarchaeota archaeon]|nr:hypothetical protein [Candidatus Micrarchaeota archaeon]
MPPHCDTMDGPVVGAAKKALDSGNVKLTLPWAPKKAEAEIRTAFEKTMHVRKLGNEARELADYWFFETVVRLHREGEGAPYTGLKPAGLDPGPVVPRVEKAIEQGDAREVITFLSHTVEEQMQKRFKHVMAKKKFDENDVDAAREYVETMLSLTLYAHHLYTFITSGGEHGEGKHAAEGHEH